MIILGIIVFSVYGKSINFGLTNLDDDTLTIRNIDYISDYRNIPDLFVNGCYFDDQISTYYRPVLNLSFMLESVFFGYNTKVYHTTNILLFIISLYLIFLFLKSLNINSTILKYLIILFALHPVLSSVPVWIPARNDSLLTIFFISSLIFFIDYLNTGKLSYCFTYLFFYALALFTKETALPLIIIYPIICKIATDRDENPQQVRDNKTFKFSTVQFFNIISFLAIFVLYIFLRHNDTVGNPDILNYIKNCGTYIRLIVTGIMIYIKQIIFPDYMPVILYNIDIPLDLRTIIVNLIAFLSLTFIYYKNFIDRKIILFSVIFFFLAIFPTFMQPEDNTILFHRLVIVIPSILLISATVIEKVLSLYPATKKYMILVWVLIIPIFSYASFNQQDKYKDSFTFWSEAYHDAPSYHIICYGLAKEYRKNKNYAKALELAEKTIKLNGIYAYYISYAIILYDAEKYDEAENIFLQLLQEEENPTVYKYLSKIFIIKNQKEKAIEYAKKAVELSSEKEKPKFYDNLSWIYSVIGQYEKSIEILTMLLQKDKDNISYYKNLSMLYEDIGNHQKAIEMKEKATSVY